MLYNVKKGTITKPVTCLNCEYYNSYLQTCNGLGKACFELDESTQTLIEPNTKLPLKLKEINNGRN